MLSKNDDHKLFGFHFGKGCHISIWATSQKEAIDKFRKMNPDLVFITDTEWARREKQRNNEPAKQLEAA